MEKKVTEFDGGDIVISLTFQQKTRLGSELASTYHLCSLTYVLTWSFIIEDIQIGDGRSQGISHHCGWTKRCWSFPLLLIVRATQTIPSRRQDHMKIKGRFSLKKARGFTTNTNGCVIPLHEFLFSLITRIRLSH